MIPKGWEDLQDNITLKIVAFTKTIICGQLYRLAFKSCHQVKINEKPKKCLHRFEEVTRKLKDFDITVNKFKTGEGARDVVSNYCTECHHFFTPEEVRDIEVNMKLDYHLLNSDEAFMQCLANKDHNYKHRGAQTDI